MPTSRLRASIALILATLVASCAGPREEPGGDAGGRADEAADEAKGVAEAPIVNGEIDEGHPAVVALTWGGQAFCSGTLVTPTLVVTAAHCLQDDSGLDVTEIEVFFGTKTGGDGDYVGVLQAVPKPDWYLDDPYLDDDIGVVRLVEPAPVEPIPIGALPPDGTTVTLVGFGITSEDGNGGGTKRITTSTLVDRESKIFILEGAPGTICSGDSGGTALATIDGVETFIGVHTRGDCLDYSVEERLDAHEDFLGPFLAGATCAADDQCSNECDEPDPDCPCAKDDVCSVACPNAADDPDCPPSCGGPGNGCGKGCPTTDVDCPLCVADGRCELGCDETPDPDCVQTTIAAVSASSGGEGEGGAGGGDGANTGDDDGCAVARPGSRSGGSPWAWLAIPLVAAFARSTSRRR